MGEGFVKALKTYTTKEQFDKEAILEDLDITTVDVDKLHDVVFENDKYKICHPTTSAGLLPLAAGTRWLNSREYNIDYRRDRTTGYDEIDTESEYGVWNMYDKYYIILDKQNPKKKWLFKNGYGDLFAPSLARYSCATWVADNGDIDMWKWFIDQKFPYISSNLNKKVGDKIIQDKTVFNYPEDTKLVYEVRRNSNITSVKIAEGTTKIKARAFSGLKLVTEIVIPEGVKSIGDQAFWMCKSLKKVILPSTLTKIGEYAFYGCESLTEIPDWPKGVNYIPNHCFSDSGLNKIIIPNNIVTIGSDAFSNINLAEKTVIIPNSVKEIKYRAFSQTDLDYIYIPDSVDTIEESALGDYWSTYYSAKQSSYTPSLVIDCESEQKPAGWDNDWDVYTHVDSERPYNPTDRYEDRYVFIRYPVNWGVKSPRKTVEENLNEDLNLSSAEFPNILNDEQCEKLLDLFISLPEIADKDKERWDFIRRKWLFNITPWSTPCPWWDESSIAHQRIDSYISSLSNPEIMHVLEVWTTAVVGIKNYFIRRLTKSYKATDEYSGGKGLDLRVSVEFIKNFLGINPGTLSDIKLHEDLDIVASDGFASEFEDAHWVVYHPESYDEFKILSSDTAWIDKYGIDDDWRYRYYKSAPYFIIVNKDTGKKWLYNTRDSYTSLRNGEGSNWYRYPDNRHIGNSRTPGNVLGAFILKSENHDGLARWAIKKWPQGLAELGSIIKSNDIIKKNNDTVAYRSDFYNELKDTEYWQYARDKNIKKMGLVKSRISNIIFPRNISKIDDEAFRGFAGIKEVKIPNTVKEIGENAFYDCQSLEKLTLPNKVQSIGSYAFFSCKKLTGNITIPITCTHLGEGIFKYCNLDTIYCEAPKKPEGWNDNWNIKNEARSFGNNGLYLSSKYVRFNVVWGSRGPVQEDLDSFPSKIIIIPEDKKDEISSTLKIKKSQLDQNKQWTLNLNPVEFNPEDYKLVKPTPYALNTGDRDYWLSGYTVNKILQLLGINLTVEDYDIENKE